MTPRDAAFSYLCGAFSVAVREGASSSSLPLFKLFPPRWHDWSLSWNPQGQSVRLGHIVLCIDVWARAGACRQERRFGFLLSFLHVTPLPHGVWRKWSFPEKQPKENLQSFSFATISVWSRTFRRFPEEAPERCMRSSDIYLISETFQRTRMEVVP